ncbi:kallikrein-2-like [Mus pahari]|uniref:kallikrein-2-like n=1 Tax=Mus pahari TaxID=10093 RepID=UPI000A308DEA|nr:kallikrein-2-like [Mus pahari]
MGLTAPNTYEAGEMLRCESKVRLGQHSLRADEDAGQYVSVRRSIPHPLYNMSLRKLTFLCPDADNSHLMLLQLSEPANVTEAVSVTSLPTEEPKLGSHCLASGWGSTRPEKCMPGTLQCVDLNLMSKDVCKKAYSKRVTGFLWCAGHQEGCKDTCMGDSGSPLICDRMLQGMEW